MDHLSVAKNQYYPSLDKGNIGILQHFGGSKTVNQQAKLETFAIFLPIQFTILAV